LIVRNRYVEQLVLNAYKMLPYLEFPIEPSLLIRMIPNCGYLSYQKFAEINKCAVDEVIQLCESASGCSHYDKSKDRYLILCNESMQNRCNPGRLRWTMSHEIGHVLCGHHKLAAYEHIAENSVTKIIDEGCESEADYFAATFLAPFPLYEVLTVHSVGAVQNTFGLSKEAATYRYETYLKWLKYRTKTAWEKDIVQIYKNKFPY